MSDPLIDAFGLAIAQADDTDGPPVDLDRILDALQGRLSTREVEELVDRTIAHPHWAAAWAEARAMLAVQASEDPTPVAAEVPQPANRPWAWGVVALAVAAAVVLVVLVGRGPDPGAYRDGPSEAVDVRSGASVPRAGATLAWSVSPDAHVRIEVLDEQLQPLAQASGLGLTTFTVPVAALEPVPPAGLLLWSLQISHPDGRQVVTPTIRTRLQD